jgi:hypothetical protein
LRTKDKHGWRAAVFFAVLAVHAVLLFLVIRAARLVSLPRRPSQSLIAILLPDALRPTRSEQAPPARVPRSSAPKHERPPPDNAITLPPEIPAQPLIDWEHERQLAAQNDVANAEKEANYRNLSGLSQDQLKWIRENRMIPAPPGITWQHPRFEFDIHSGLPIYWINDHCVLVLLMAFCGIGHIEPNGQLFDHMHDAPEPNPPQH